MITKSSLEVLEVSLAKPDGERLKGRNLEAPKPGTHNDAASITVAGWVLGRKSRAEAVEIVNADEVVARIQIDMDRPDLAERLKDDPEAARAGFRTVLEAAGSGESELLVRAALEDGSRAHIGWIRVRVFSDGQPSAPKVRRNA